MPIIFLPMMLIFFQKKRFHDKTYDELLKMDEKEFKIIFEGTPVKRTKYKGWARNLIKAKPEC